MQHPTLQNVRIRSTRDALQVFHGVATHQLPLITRRLDAEERRNIVPGNVYVWSVFTSTDMDWILEMLILLSVREERGANTEPTGLGMERWCAKCSIIDNLSISPLCYQDWWDGMGPQSCVSYPFLLGFVVLNHQWLPFAGVRDVRQSLHYPSFPKMKFWRSNNFSGVSILSSEGLWCDRRSCQSRNSVGTNDEVSLT